MGCVDLNSVESAVSGNDRSVDEVLNNGFDFFRSQSSCTHEFTCGYALLTIVICRNRHKPTVVELRDDFAVKSMY